MQKTNIEYLTHTWNPLTMRCTPVSEGCANCWHLGMLKRMVANPMIPNDRKKAYQGGPPVLIKKELTAPLKAKKPAIIGVQFMGDLFHENVPDKYIDRVFATMALCPQHTFLVLTKRPDRMREYMDVPRGAEQEGAMDEIVDHHLNGIFPDGAQSFDDEGLWPLPNVWLGTTAENQPMADLRIPELVRLKGMFPEIVIWVSVEPMLSAIRLDLGLGLIGGPGDLDWIVCGGESGSGARPMHPDWPRSIRDQCKAAGVPFFFKQWGEWVPGEGSPNKTDYVPNDGSLFVGDPALDVQPMVRVGSARAGRLLDGRTWDEVPGGV